MKKHYFTLTLVLRSRKILPKYPLYRVTYSDAKFEVATSDGLGGNAFTKKYIF